MTIRGQSPIQYVLDENPGIDVASADFMNKVFTVDPLQARSNFYVRRNTLLLKFVDDREFGTVFELAGATGLFAEMFLNQHPETKTYVHSDYSVVACQLALKYLKPYHSRVYEKVFDIRKDLDSIDWNLFDLVVSTSMEHFPEGYDYTILNHMKSGTHVLWSLCKVEAEIQTHLRPYISKDYVKKRFSRSMRIIGLREYKSVVLLHGVRL